MLTAVVALIAGLFAPAAAQAAETLPARATAPHTASQFDAGYIVSDQVFYNGAAMTQAEIQAFLNRMVGTCTNSLCLNVLKAPTFDKPKDRDNCNAYDGGGNETAAAIIYKVQVACGISAKVILVTLQKEQGLITHKGPTAGRLAAAMGWKCPDSAPCDASAASFFKQVYGGAWQFKRYKSTIGSDGGYEPFGTYRAGGRYNIKYHPNGGCGTKKVSIRNWATAALYNYTPYTPNAAALANMGDVAPPCGSYGNRNFWDYYYTWFGSPTTMVPPGSTAARLAGADRYATSIAISKLGFPAAFPAGTGTVFIATGENYADALAAAPIAAKNGGPLLLTRKAALLPAIKAELQRLKPANVVIVGGDGAVANKVVTEIKTALPAAVVARVSGADRYDTAVKLGSATFPSGGATVAFIVNGQNFADALSASSAAGALGGIVILVKAEDPRLSDQALALLQSSGVTRVMIAGGPAVVSAELQTALAASVPGVTIERAGGSDRYHTSLLINQWAYDLSDNAFIASGRNYPDALSAAAVAGVLKAPLLLSNGGCVKSGAIENIIAGGVKKVYWVGGTGVLPTAVLQYPTCA